MKIMFVTPAMSFGGAERVMSLLSNEFVRRGMEVSFVVMDDSKALAYTLDSKVQLNYMETARFNKSSDFFRLIKHLRSFIITYNPDVIISFINSTFVFSWIASWGLHTPLVFSERNDPYNNINGFKSKVFQWISIHKANHIVFQTEPARDYYDKKIVRKSSVILNPFDASRLPERSRTPEKTIVSVGRLCTQKNQKIQIEAFCRIKDKYPDYKLLIYGEGPLKDELTNQIAKYGLEGRVILKGTSTNVMEEIASAGLFVFTSDFEGLPNALIEAMALGLPCISTDCSPGGARALIKDGENGLLVNCGDVASLVNGIEKMIDNREFAVHCGDKARAIATELNVNDICDKWQEIFTGIVL